MLDDFKKVGIGLICLGYLFLALGMLFFFNSRFLTMGNTLFMLGLCFILGLQNTYNTFAKRSRWQATLCLFLGFLMVLFGKLVIVGLLLEGWGFIKIFGSFIPTALSFAKNVPYLSWITEIPGVTNTVDFIAGKTRPKYSV